MSIFRIGTVALLAAVAVPSAKAEFIVQLRDAVGGEYANGNPGGPLLAGTGSLLIGTDSNGPFETFFVGAYDLELDAGGGFQSLITYCLETDQNILFGENPPDDVGLTYQVEALSGAQGFSQADIEFAGILWAHAWAISQTDAALAAAFQAIVWELANDDSIDLVSGNFQLSTADSYTAQVIGTADQWIDNISSGQWTQSVQLVALTHSDSQDFLTVAIPSPSALSLAAAALVLRGGSRSRRR